MQEKRRIDDQPSDKELAVVDEEREIKKKAVTAFGVDAMSALTGDLSADAVERLIKSRHKKAYGFLVDLVTELTSVAGLQASPIEQAVARGLVAKQELLSAEGGVLSGGDLAKLFHPALSRQAVDQRRNKKQLFALADGSGHFSYPAWQVHQGTALPGLAEVLGALSNPDPMAAVLFYLDEDPRLEGRRPLDAARAGEIELVVSLARTFGEHGAL
jgi:hypothetical protein